MMMIVRNDVDFACLSTWSVSLESEWQTFQSFPGEWRQKLLDQVNDPLQQKMLRRYKRPDCECLCVKAPYIAVNRISVTRPGTPIEDFLGDIE
jgi:hypothetical protein